MDRDLTATGRTRAARLALAALAVTATCLTTACSGADDAGPAATSSTSSATLTVLAAASLTDAFTTLGARFEDANPGTTVTFSFGGSSALATQIDQGAPADVFASASEATMDAVVAAGHAASPEPFARNVMEIAVPADNPATITGLDDLARDDVSVALCQAEVPCGAAARTVLANAGLTVRPVTEESDVKATLAKVTLGEVDAGLVYATDVLAAGGQARGVPIPPDLNASTTYPIAALDEAREPGLADAFVAYVLSADGLAVLRDAGFEAP